MLVFLTGQREVEALCRRLRKAPSARRARPPDPRADPSPGASAEPAGEGGGGGARGGPQGAAGVGDETLENPEMTVASRLPAEGVDAFGGDAAEEAGEVAGALANNNHNNSTTPFRAASPRWFCGTMCLVGRNILRGLGSAA